MPAVDTFPTTASGKDSSAEHAFAVTPNDSTDLAFVTRGLYVGVGGDVKVTMVSGDVAVFVGLAGGMVHPLRVARVWAGSTTATSILGVY